MVTEAQHGITLTEASAGDLSWYARVSIAYEVREAVDVDTLRLGVTTNLVTYPVSPPYCKDYDVTRSTARLHGRHGST